MRPSKALLATAFMLCSGSAQAQGITRAFGHSVSVSSPSGQGPKMLRVDGRALMTLSEIRLDEVSVLQGTGFVVGYASDAGSSCDASPFLLSFPASGAPRLDGPVAGCGAKVAIEADRVRISAQPEVGQEGETWEWTPDAGLVRGPMFRRTASSESGWDKLRSREIDRPAQLLDYADTGDQIRRMVEPNMAAVRPILTGTGSGRVSGTSFEGESCKAHDCLTNGLLVYADIPSRRIYMAWRVTGSSRTTSVPAVGDWPEEGKRAWTGWTSREASGR